MKVFFTAPPRGKLKEYKNNYYKIYELLEKIGLVQVSDFIKIVKPLKFSSTTEEQRKKHYLQMTKDIKTADIVVLETSLHSLALGFMANLALDLGKPVIALHIRGKSPYFLSGVANEKLQVLEYSLDKLETILTDAVDYASEKIDTRFNFFISPKIGNYLSWISKKKKLPRAVYLRRLIEQEMELNKEYS